MTGGLGGRYPQARLRGDAPICPSIVYDVWIWILFGLASVSQNLYIRTVQSWPVGLSIVCCMSEPLHQSKVTTHPGVIGTENDTRARNSGDYV